MKKLFPALLLIYLFSTSFIFAQPGEWVWLHGNNSSGSTGNFGVQGVSAPTNMPPATYESCEWTDLNGNFWLFGGLTSSYSSYGDLWKYNPSINEWVWMRGTGTTGDPGSYGTMGVSSPTNRPPARSWGIASWVDNLGNLWLFGGNGGAVYADLWKYDIITNEWTWMKGPAGNGGAGNYGTQGVPDPANNPSGRFECVTAWTDNNGDLWLFGGYSGMGFNDLWRFNIASNNWTWMKGTAGGGGAGVYGTQGVEAPANTPGARQAYSHWKDSNGNLWLFAGYDYVNAILYNDLWRYNPVSNNWAWIMGGTSTGIYNNQCQSDSTSIPGGRLESRATTTDPSGNFWLFGGGVGTSSQNVYNDLWKYCVASGQWTWISGDNFPNSGGNWGTLGVSSPLNKPFGRDGNLMWCDQTGNIYIFGGTDQTWPTVYNDLWKYTIDPACGSCNTLPQAIFTAPNHICPGTCTDFTNLSINGTSFLWSFAGANPSTSTDVNPLNICYNTPGSYTVSLIATNANGSDTITLNNFITVYGYPPPQGISQSGDTLFANAGAVSYQWYFGGVLIPGATDYYYIASQSGDYNIVATDLNGCEVEAVIYDVIAAVPSEMNADVKANFEIFPNPASGILTIRRKNTQSFLQENNPISIRTLLGEQLFAGYTQSGTGLYQVDVSKLAQGFYYLEINSRTEKSRIKFIKN